jgi:hypothetical protein
MADPSRVGIYRWYNLETREYEQPIALCEFHRGAVVDRPGAVLERITDTAAVMCGTCANLAAGFHA